MTKKELDYLAEKVAVAIVDKMFNSDDFEAVSYTHLTLPTICSV